MIEELKYGLVNDDNLYEYYLTLTDIIYEDTDEVVVLPSEYEGRPITHFGYKQDFEEKEARWHDWHHPAQGMDYTPARYYLSCKFCEPPAHVKKVIFPATAKNIFTNIFNTDSVFHPERQYSVLIEIDENNPVYRVEDNKIVLKNPHKW